MKDKSNGFLRAYATALKKSLERGAGAGLPLGTRLGKLAVARKIGLLELARIHDQALVRLGFSGGKPEVIRRAEVFFAEALVPIIESHPPARRDKAELGRLAEALTQRTKELAATTRQRDHGIIQGKRVEEALKNSGLHYSKLLKESLELQEGLRQLTHQVLAAGEDERRKISQELQDDIAQTLLGINVRLTSLKRGAKVHSEGVSEGIASTQRMVTKSARTVRRVAGKLGKL